MDIKELESMLDEAIIFLFAKYDTNILAEFQLSLDNHPGSLFLERFTVRLAKFRPDLFVNPSDCDGLLNTPERIE